MKFDYLKQPSSLDPRKRHIARPIIPVILWHGKKDFPVLALVDSGADNCLFHSSIADELGIPWWEGERVVFGGISEAGIDVYFHEIGLQIKGHPQIISIKAGFTQSKGVSAVLGQEGFFDNYQVKFERYKERLEINPRRDQ